jgi:hypothetical protein
MIPITQLFFLMIMYVVGLVYWNCALILSFLFHYESLFLFLFSFLLHDLKSIECCCLGE